MTFARLAYGAAVFLDANIFVYHFGPHATFAPVCTDLLERINRQELQGFTCARVLSDVAHRLMTLEACAVLKRSFPGIGSYLKKHPAAVQQLSRFRQAILDIPGFGVRLLPTPTPVVETATALSIEHGLLSGDALIVAVMQTHGLSDLASADTDFDRVPGITRYWPA
jgi:predicted nucleic acid-binding protein